MTFDNLIPADVVDRMPPGLRKRWDKQKRLNNNEVGNMRVDALDFHLYESAKDFAQFALTHYADPYSITRIQSAVAAGSAVEYLARCVVFDGDPVLLAQPNHHDSRVALSRIPNASALNPKKLKTISATETVSLISKIHPAKFPSTSRAEEVFALRNAAAHMAFALQDDVETDMVNMVIVIGELLSIIEKNEDKFWGENLSHVARLMKKQASDAVKNRVRTLIASARERYARLVAQFDESHIEAMLQGAEARTFPPRFESDDIEERRQCPACGRSGYLSLIKVVDSANALPTKVEDYPADLMIYATAVGVPASFQCPVCSVLLTDVELESFPDLNAKVHLKDELVLDIKAAFGLDEDPE